MEARARSDFYRACRRDRSRGAAGFTLVELIAVIVILSLIAVVGTQFVVTSLQAYRQTESRGQLVQSGRVAVEQMSRQLRMAVPNSVRISSTGNCIEFMPVVAVTTYQGQVADASNGKTAAAQVTTAPFSRGPGQPVHALISPYFASEIYTAASPSARTGISALGASPHTLVTFSAAARFLRNSLNNRLYIADNPQRFCVVDGQLVRHRQYGLLSGALSDAAPGGSTDLMALGVSTPTTAFALFPGSEVRRAGVTMDLRFTADGQTVALQQQVYIRNVP